jgi:hypothetical protein
MRDFRDPDGNPVRLAGRRRDRHFSPENEDSEYEEIVTRRVRKRPRLPTPEPETPREEEITNESILRFFQISDGRFTGLLSDYFPNSGRKARLTNRAPVLPEPFRIGDAGKHGTEGLREATTLAGHGFGYLFLSLFDRKVEFIIKGIELFAAAFTLVQEERLFPALNLEKDLGGAIMGQDVPRTVAQAYTLNLFRQGAGGNQLPGRPHAHAPSVQLPLPMVPMGAYPYPIPGYPPTMLPTPSSVPPSPVPDIPRRYASPSPLAQPRSTSPRLPEPATLPLASTGDAATPRSQSRSRSLSRSGQRLKSDASPLATRSRGRGRGRGTH